MLLVSASRATLPSPFTNAEDPSILRLTRGTITPTSKSSVTPTVPDIASIFDRNSRFAVPTRALRGIVELIDPSGRLCSSRSLSLSYVDALNVAPTLTWPSPDVNARSVNDGPNVVAVRARRPVVGSNLKTKPPEDVPNGDVPI